MLRPWDGGIVHGGWACMRPSAAISSISSCFFLYIYIDLCAIKNYINRNRGASGMAAWVLVFVCISTSPSL